MVQPWEIFVMDYGGDLTVRQCWDLLGESDDTFLIDVRTSAEWAYVGLPKLASGMRDLILQEWQLFPQMSVDQQFSDKLQAVLMTAGADANSTLCFLCRSGVRSLAAAVEMTATGYRNTFNVTGGFEGDLDEYGHRGARNGWKAEGLPWHQR